MKLNSLKAKVMSALAMLVIAAIMLTSASFAWYTVSQQGDLNKVKVQMEAVDNLEIAVASESELAEVGLGDAETKGQKAWGTTATYDEDGATLSQLATMSDGALKTVSYDDTGRIEEELVAVATEYSPAVYDIHSATAKLLKTETGDKAAAAEFDCYIRTNVDTPYKIKCNSATFTGKGMTVVCTASGQGTFVNNNVTWKKDEEGGYAGEIEVTPQLNDGYSIVHVVLTAFVDGDTTVAADIDSDTAVMPSFEGSIKAYRN